MPGLFEFLFGSSANSNRNANNGLSDDPKEVITILGKGTDYDFFGALRNHARSVIDNYLRNPQKSIFYDNKYRVLTKAITEPITFDKAYIEGNFISVFFRSDADIDVANSYDSKKYVSKHSYDVVYIEVVYHISELVIKNNKLVIVKTINTRSDYPRLATYSFGIGKDEVSERRFFVLSGNVRNSIVKRVSLYGGDDINVDWEVKDKESSKTTKPSGLERSTDRSDIIDLEYIDDKMSGLEFEKIVGLLLSRNGFKDVKVTKASNDYGCDVIATKDFIKYAVQCKKYSSPVGIEAVQAVLGSKEMYKCHVAVVLTNNTFTPNAKTLADKTNVLLWGRDVLSTLLLGSTIRKSDIK